MDDRPPFDPIKACFYLIAAILGVHCVIAVVGVGFCVYWGDAITSGRFKCENVGASLTELLSAALAAALAFAGGSSRKP